jgi:hypothetical protein
MPPNPTIERTVIVKYRASTRVSDWVKLEAENRSITPAEPWTVISRPGGA